MASAKKLKQQLTTLIARGRVGHAYLLFGEEAAAHIEFWQSFAALLERGVWGESFHSLTDARTLAGAANGGIDMVREAGTFLWGKPFVSRYKTLIISDLHRCTVHAQNALLKLVEEPPEHGLVLATAIDPDSLIDPLASRFQKLFMSSENGVPVSSKPSAAVAEVLGSQSARARSELLKAIAAEDATLDQFIRDLFLFLRSDFERYGAAFVELSRRSSLMRRYNVNKKLQLEAVFERIANPI